MRTCTKTITDLKIGEKAIISGFSDDSLSLKLLEMGCLPGTEVELTGIAPLGDPICISLMDYQLSLRKEEAAKVLLEHD